MRLIGLLPLILGLGCTAYPLILISLAKEDFRDCNLLEKIAFSIGIVFSGIMVLGLIALGIATLAGA